MSCTRGLRRGILFLNLRHFLVGMASGQHVSGEICGHQTENLDPAGEHGLLKTSPVLERPFAVFLFPTCCELVPAPSGAPHR